MKALKEIQITSWEAFEKFVSKYKSGSIYAPNYIYRGQADSSWTLQPSLCRLVTGLSLEEVLAIEEHNLRHFMKHARIFLDGPMLPKDHDWAEWLVLMQHYGSPTRLLDWTASPYVGLYSATVDKWDVDGAVWMTHPLSVRQVLAGDFTVNALDNSNEPLFAERIELREFSATGETARVFAFRSDNSTDRIKVQQGEFTISNSPLVDHLDVLDQTLSDHPELDRFPLLLKIVVPARLKPEFQAKLRRSNVTGSSLFPGLDGLGKELRELTRLECRDIGAVFED